MLAVISSVVDKSVKVSNEISFCEVVIHRGMDRISLFIFIVIVLNQHEEVAHIIHRIRKVVVCLDVMDS